MKIIKQGIDPDTIPLKGECSHCKTVVEFLKIEAKHQPALCPQRDVDSYTVDCPTCKRPITAYQ